MATQTRFPSTAGTAAVATESANDWLNPTNIFSDDAAEAQITAATYDSPDISFRLLAQGFDFASVILAGSVINGITVEIDRRCFAGSARDFRVQLLDDTGALIGDNKADIVTNWPVTTAIKSYGGAADTWGIAGLTADMIRSANFGVVLSVSAVTANADIGVDFIRVTIDYTPPVQVEISGAVSASSSATGNIASKSGVIGEAAGAGVVAGELGNVTVIAGQVSSSGVLTGVLINLVPLQGQSNGLGLTDGELLDLVELIGTVIGVGVAVAAFEEETLEGVVIGVGSLAGNLELRREISGQAEGTALTDAVLDRLVLLLGHVVAVGAVTGDLDKILGTVIDTPPCPSAVVLENSRTGVVLGNSNTGCTLKNSQTGADVICLTTGEEEALING